VMHSLLGGMVQRGSAPFLHLGLCSAVPRPCPESFHTKSHLLRADLEFEVKG
jgi:hypothetical protein